VRELVRGNTKEEVQRKINNMIARDAGWKQISDIKEDPSMIRFNIVEYAAVMERPGDAPTKKSKWGMRR
jgi:hypothetical protein